MGNSNEKKSHSSTGSPLDFFQTPPTTPSEGPPTAMASAQTPSSPDPARKPSSPSEWAVISVDSVVSAETDPGDGAARPSRAAVSLCSPPSPSEQSWQERDSGLEPQAAAETSPALLSLMEHYRNTLGPNHDTDTDAISGAAELLRHLIRERDELVEEVNGLRETLRTERSEWHQFQCDLQVAVAVADRLRVESERTLSSLQQSHRSVTEQLARACSREQETLRELEELRADHRDLCCRLSDLTQQQTQQRAELDALRNAYPQKETEDGGHGQEEVQAVNEESESNLEVRGHTPEEGDGSGSRQLTGWGVAEGYLRSLAALERRKDPRRIVMLSERSRSLSRLPSPTDSGQRGSSRNTSTTLPLSKKDESTTQRRRDRVLQRQDSWSSFSTGKQDEGQSADSIKPQDGFSALLRRHGGSRRNSLLRWCQSRTQGYKEVDITNFSSSWEDGLAFCAVYHSYLPTHIAYDSLEPANKRENLATAFKTGECVGITASLTVEEMLKNDGPDWQRVLGYVESMFRHFEM